MDKTYQEYQLKVGFLNILNYNYVIIDKATKETAIIDPAWNLNKIVKMLRDIDGKLTTILLTHSHYDHTNLTDSLVKMFNCQVYMLAEEIDYYKFRCKNLNSIQDLNMINLGETRIACLSTPGHTFGGASFLLSDSLFTGDTIFIEGCGMCTKGGCPEQLYKSIKRIKKVVKPYVRVYPGHSFGEEPGQTINRLLKENIYFQIEKMEQFINFRMRKNQKKLFDFK